MKIFLLTSVYPAKDAPKGTTPVVHYFAKEWALAGHQVHVFHTESSFPRLYYLIGKLFKKALDSRLGFVVPTNRPVEYEETKDGVIVTHLLLKKIKPHGRFSRKQINKAFLRISNYIETEGVPNCFVGHWDNPQLDLLHVLKEKYHRPTCLVYHSNQFVKLYRCYGSDLETLVNDIDLIGFRNMTAEKNYIKLFGQPKRCFIAASGVSRPFIESGDVFDKKINKIERFIYVGTLISRKYPTIVITALSKAYQNSPFDVIFVGEGNEKNAIQQQFDRLGCMGNLIFTGRISREDVIGYLKQSDVFVMISKGEVFGLVYLEAMALGCITIAARHQGIDGIIKDGENGFLCEAGNAEELASIINKIRQMSSEALMDISKKAKQTANEYSDVKVALRYSKELEKLLV